MPNDHTLPKPSMDPHGYFPVCVDEDCLTDADRREAIVTNVATPRNWGQYVTTKEQQEVDDEVVDIKRRMSGIFYKRDPQVFSEKRTKLAQRGVFRSFARERYASGQEIWYGDGPTPWSR